MLQGVKIESLTRAYQREENTSQITFNWSRIFYAIQCIALFAFPIGAIMLSIASDYMFLKEILSATFLITLILFVKVAGGKA